MNGDFTQWDLYLASSSEYAMRLIDGFISMLESRNLVCVAQFLRAHVGVCLRTIALFAAEDQDDYLKQVFQGVPVKLGRRLLLCRVIPCHLRFRY